MKKQDTLLTVILHGATKKQGKDVKISLVQHWDSPLQTNWLLINGQPNAIGNVMEIVEIIKDYIQKEDGRNIDIRTNKTKELSNKIREEFLKE